MHLTSLYTSYILICEMIWLRALYSKHGYKDVNVYGLNNKMAYTANKQAVMLALADLQ